MYRTEIPYKQNRTILQQQRKKQSVHIVDNRQTMFDNLTMMPSSVENNKLKTIQKVGQTYYLNIEIAGSGNETIRGNKGPSFGKISERGTIGHFPPRILDGTILYYQIQGPSKILNGVFDVGPNSIENISSTLFEEIKSILSENDENTIMIDIRGHSRGAVAISFLLDKIEQSSYKRRIYFNSIIQYDPVPGQTLSGAEMSLAVHTTSPYYKKSMFEHRDKIKCSAVVYSVYTQYGKEQEGTTVNSFVPQAIFGTDIIIIELKNHSVGLPEFSEFKDLNISPGVYIRNEDDNLIRILSLNEFVYNYYRGMIYEYQRKQAGMGLTVRDNEEIIDRIRYQNKRTYVILQVVTVWFLSHNSPSSE